MGEYDSRYCVEGRVEREKGGVRQQTVTHVLKMYFRAS
jgi:hypothetical protein